MWLDAWSLDHGVRRDLAETFLQGCSQFLAKAMIQAHAHECHNFVSKYEMENLVDHYALRFADAIRAAFKDYHQGSEEEVEKMLLEIFGEDDQWSDAKDVDVTSEKDQMESE